MRREEKRPELLPKMSLASPDRLAEDVGVLAVVVAELELRDVQRHIFGAHLVKGADNTAFEDRPEAFNRVGVDRANNVLALGVIYDAMRELAAEFAVTAPLIRAQQANFLGNCATHESGKSCGINAIDDARHDVAAPADGTDDWSFPGTDATSSAAPAALVFMSVLGEAINEGFINLDDAHEFLEIFVGEARPHAMAHVPSGPVGTETHHAVNLKCADPFLACQHQVDDPKPLAERLVRVLEDRAADVRETVIGCRRGTSITKPVPFHCAVRLDVGIATTRADDKLGPAMLGKVEAARIFVREGGFPFRDCHLADRFWLFRSGHGHSPSRQEAA